MGASPIEAMLHAIEIYPLPVVAVVQGDAIAGGNELALHCDLVVASKTARFGMSLAQIGLAPSWFLAKKLLEVAGPGHDAPDPAARRSAARRAPLRAGRHLAHRRAAELEAVAAKVIERLAANAPLSLKAMKALIVREMAFRDGIAHEDVDALVEEVRRSARTRRRAWPRASPAAQPSFKGQ